MLRSEFAREVEQLCSVMEQAYETCVVAHLADNDSDRRIAVARTLSVLTFGKKLAKTVDGQLELLFDSSNDYVGTIAR